MTQSSTIPKKAGECFSMTGYAQSRHEQNGWAVRVSVKSVNHRFLDLKLRLPEGFDLYELRLRQVLRDRLHRGHVEVHVNVDPAAAAPVQVNRELAQTYMRVAEEFRQQSRAARRRGCRCHPSLARSHRWPFRRCSGSGRRPGTPRPGARRLLARLPPQARRYAPSRRPPFA